MIQFLSNVPIFRRLFIAFALATIIPGIAIVLLGNFYISSLTTRGQAVKISFDAQSLAGQEQGYLERMNALLQAKFYEIFASHSRKIADPSLAASGALVDGDIRSLEADFDRNLRLYLSTYELATSSNMSTLRTILQSSDVENGDVIIASQKQALDLISNQEWTNYKKLQDDTLSALEKLQKQLTDHTENGVLVPAKIYEEAELNQVYISTYDTLYQANQAFTGLKNNWQNVADISVQMGKAVTNVGASQIQPIFMATGGAFILIILVIIFTAYLVNRTITSPLSQLSSLAERIAEGNTNARAEVKGRDEIAKVANTMNTMLNNIVRLIQDAQNQHEVLQARVEKLVSEVSGVGEGDLRIQAEVTTDALGVLADSFNYMVEELSSLVVRVKQMANEVENSTAKTFNDMTMLVSNADIQIQQIGKAAREVEQMANSSRLVAERSQSLYAIANEARRTATNGRESVQQTVEGMSRIQSYVQDTATKVQALGESSREIDNIVGVISTIAHQTNRLALDAAVQAATAGENGKGFAAVAADIRRLAERAKDQANTIARIVRIVSEDIEAAAASMKDTERETSSGSKMAEDTGVALESIFRVVERQGGEIELINQMSTQQLQSSNAVVYIMQGVSQSTQRSSAGTREAARNMEHLARLAEQLLASVEAFKLREIEAPRPSHNGQQGIPYNAQTVLSTPTPMFQGSLTPYPPQFQPRSLTGPFNQPQIPQSPQPVSGPFGSNSQSGPFGSNSQSGPFGSNSQPGPFAPNSQPGPFAPNSQPLSGPFTPNSQSNRQQGKLKQNRLRPPTSSERR